MSKYNDFNRIFQIDGEEPAQNDNNNLVKQLKIKQSKIEARIDNYYAEYEAGSEQSITQDLSEYSIVDIISTVDAVVREHVKDLEFYRLGKPINPIYLAIRVVGILESEKLAEYQNNNKDTESERVLSMIRNRQRWF